MQKCQPNETAAVQSSKEARVFVLLCATHVRNRSNLVTSKLIRIIIRGTTTCFIYIYNSLAHHNLVLVIEGVRE